MEEDKEDDGGRIMHTRGQRALTLPGPPARAEKAAAIRPQGRATAPTRTYTFAYIYIHTYTYIYTHAPLYARICTQHRAFGGASKNNAAMTQPARDAALEHRIIENICNGFRAGRLAILLVPTVRQKNVVPLHKSIATLAAVALSGNLFGLTHKILSVKQIESPRI